MEATAIQGNCPVWVEAHSQVIYPTSGKISGYVDRAKKPHSFGAVEPYLGWGGGGV